MKAAKNAAHAINGSKQKVIAPLTEETIEPLHKIIQMPRTVENARKAAVMKKHMKLQKTIIIALSKQAFVILITSKMC